MYIVASYYKHVCKKSDLSNNGIHHVKTILLLKNHLLDVKISIKMVKHTTPPDNVGSFVLFLQQRPKTDRMGPSEDNLHRSNNSSVLKIMSFLLNQIAQHKADTPIRILYMSFLIIYPPKKYMLNVHRWLQSST
jgi:hypothetical protein